MTILHATTCGADRGGREAALMARVECVMRAVRQEIALIGSLLKSPDRVVEPVDGGLQRHDTVRVVGECARVRLDRITQPCDRLHIGVDGLVDGEDRITVAYDGLTVAYDRIREHLHRLSQLLRRLADLFQRLGVLHRQRLQLPEAFLWGQLAMLMRLNAGNIRAIAIRGRGDPMLTALILGHGFLLEHGLDLLRYGQRLLEHRQPLRHHTPYRKGAR